MISREQNERMAARARTLADVIETPGDGRSPRDPESVVALLDRWRDQVADGDDEAFSARLAIAGASDQAVRQGLEAVDWPTGESLPPWVDWIDDLLAFVETADYDCPSPDSPDASDVPFVDVLSPIVAYAASELDASVVREQLDERAMADFEEWLRTRLRGLLSHALFIEFKTYLADRDPDLAFAEEPVIPAQPRRHYDSFVDRLLDGELASFFVEYAVLSKLLATIVEQWIDAVTEFCVHLEADRDVLERSFGVDDLGLVTVVEALGDHHHGGRRVFAVTFASGLKLAYKPRDLAIDDRFGDFVRWVNDRTSLPDLRPLECLPRGDHGWVEWVEPEACETDEDVARYYRRAGTLLGILYALNFTDGHIENLVAVGDQPVLVDLETLAHPTLPEDHEVIRNVEVAECIRESVLRTAFLPMHFPDADLKRIGGLGATTGEQTGIEAPEFTNVNTDAMDLTYRTDHRIEGNSLPHLDGDAVAPADYHEEIAAGFEGVYRLLLDRRDELLGPGGPIESFAGVECRVLLRPTETYGKLRVPLTNPSYLRSGVTWDTRVERLARPFATGSVAREMWPVYLAEREATWAFDVPRFTVETTTTDLAHGEVIVEDAFDDAPLEQVRERIRALSEADLDEQLDYLALAYAHERLAYPDPPQTGGSEPAERRSAVELASHVPRDVFERILEHANHTPDGVETWFLREYRADGAYLHGVPHDLYNGRAGVALLGAALATVFDDHDYRAFTSRVCSPLFEELESDEPFADMKLGGASGIASLAYAFTTIGDLLDDSRYLSAAREVVDAIAPELIHSDEVFDALSGSAGVILGVLPLYERTGDRDVLDVAIRAGDHLLEQSVDWNGVPVWRTIRGDPPQVGVSHGIAGIAYALARLADVTGEARYQTAAEESLAYERARYDPDRNNWPDLQSGTGTDFSRGWRAGRAGIGLVRLRMSELDGHESAREEVHQALHGCDPSVLSPFDHVCDGNFGRVDFLVCAAQSKPDDRYLEWATRLTNDAVARAERAGRFTVPWQTERWYNPSFYVGEAGIAYTSLRLAHPELPCVLAWD